MPHDGRSRPPLRYRRLVWAAGWLVPGRARIAWREKWDSVFSSVWVLAQRGEIDPQVLQQCSRDCLSEVFRGWIGRERQLLHSPRFMLAGALLTIAVIGIVSHGFAGTRALFQPLPVDDPDRLVRIRYTGAAGQPAGVPPRVLPSWRANASLVSGIASYLHKPYAPLARVTTNFFSVLGAKTAEGRLFKDGDRDVAVLSRPARQALFGLNSPVLGRRIKVEGRSYTVIGVLPDSFWAISPRVTVWIPLQVEPGPGGAPETALPILIPVIARMKPGAMLEKVRTDLFNAARAGTQMLPRRPEVVPFTAVTEPQLPNYLFGIGFGIAIGAVIVTLQQPFRLRHSWRYGRLLAAKTLLLVAIPALGWVEAGSAIQSLGPPDTPGVAIGGIVVTLVFLALCAFAFWWSFADQRRRCPQCLQLLAMPVTIGSWSSVLDPATTEFLCESGHGSLYLPETEQGEPDRWAALDPSWRELFEKVTPEGS
jgi:MacB-like periplasmic core domain